jgi:hypothetical protein
MNCPKCEESLSTVWVKGRKLQQRCPQCYWSGEPYAPPQREIETTRRVSINSHGGFQYTVYDRFGWPAMTSRSYPTLRSAQRAAERDIERGRHNEEAGPYTAVLWRDYVEVRGEVIT